ncbi:MAG: MEDS domain-containing protein [Nitrososphaerota archaeon]|nr:MEDS domain-containing protein [Nitrososphaerota archaeon]
MSEAGIELSRKSDRFDELEPGAHFAHVFESNSDKQKKLFALCSDCVGKKNAYLLYIAGKQGVKGIRLSLKDVGFDVASYERNAQFKIVDSEQWYLNSGRQTSFKSFDEIYAEVLEISNTAARGGFSMAVVISETDMLVRKGHYAAYRDMDTRLADRLRDLNIGLVCVFDKRELQAAGIPNALGEVSGYHSVLI